MANPIRDLERAPVTIIIPTRNQARLLKRCIDSVRMKTGYRNYELLVVDNQSDEFESVHYLSELEGQGIGVLSYTRPFNYSAINNFAVEKAQGQLLCFLNNDMEVITSEWLEEMVSHACGRRSAPWAPNFISRMKPSST